MPGSNTTMFGIYLSFANLRKCVDCLKAIGCRTSDISVLSPDREATPPRDPVNGQSAIATTGSEAMMVGSLGWFTYISTPPVGLLARALTSLGVPAYEAERYEIRIKNGAILLSVRSTNPVWTQRISDILKQTGAEELSKSEDASLSILGRATPGHASKSRAERTGMSSESRQQPAFEARAS
ncbi:MAG: hypothetical protein ACREAC_25505 [Blastocatellia bacterium]